MDYTEMRNRLREDIKDIAYVRRQIAKGGPVIFASNERNNERLIEACDKIQFELELSLERCCRD